VEGWGLTLRRTLDGGGLLVGCRVRIEIELEPIQRTGMMLK
jgi:hypothetical protein